MACHKCDGLGYYLEEIEKLGQTYEQMRVCLCPAAEKWKGRTAWLNKTETDEKADNSRSTIEQAGMDFEQAAKGSKLPEDPPF